MLTDLRYAVRSLRRSPAFAVATVLTLALGIGANTAVALPYPEPDRLAKIVGTNTRDGTLGNLSPADFADFDR